MKEYVAQNVAVVQCILLHKKSPRVALRLSLSQTSADCGGLAAAPEV